MFGAGLRLFPWYREDLVKTPFFDSDPVAQIVSALMFAGVLARKRKGSLFLYGALLVPWAMPVYISVPLWRALIHGNGGQSLLTALFGIEAIPCIETLAHLTE